MRRTRRGPVLRPFREKIRVVHHGCSTPLKRRISDFGAERSGRSTVDALVEHYRIEVPLYTVDKVVRETARRASAYNSERPAGESAATVQVSGVDGSMVPIVEFKGVGEVSDPEKKADKRKRRECLWKEIRVCTVHDTRRADTCYGASFGGLLETELMMRATSEQCGMDGKTHIHAVGDGATWIAEAYERQFGTQSEYLVDFYHVCEYLAEAAESCAGANPTPAGRKKWIERQKHWLKQNRVGQALRNLEKYVESPGVADEHAPVRRCWRYLNNRRDQLDYKGALEKGLPIGSGETESAHRHLIQRHGPTARHARQRQLERLLVEERRVTHTFIHTLPRPERQREAGPFLPRRHSSHLSVV